MAVPARQSGANWPKNRWSAQGDLLIRQTTPTDGIWQPVEGFWPLTVIVGGTATSFSAELLVCNAIARPADSDNAWPSLQTFRAPAVRTYSTPLYWIKLRLTAITVAGGDQGISANYQAAGQGS